MPEREEQLGKFSNSFNAQEPEGDTTLFSLEQGEQEVHGFTIDIIEISEWFAAFKKAQDGKTPKKDITLGKVVSDSDPVFQEILFTGHVLENPMGIVQYNLEVKGRYSKQSINSGKDFNPISQIALLQEILENSEVEVWHKTGTTLEQYMLLRYKSIHCGVDLGHAESNSYRRDTKKDKKLPNRQFNSPLQLITINDEHESPYRTHSDPDTFRKDLQEFVELSEIFFNSYYKTKNGPVGKHVRLQVPEWKSYKENNFPLKQDIVAAPDTVFDPVIETLKPLGHMITEEERQRYPTLDEIGGQPEALAAARSIALSINDSETFESHAGIPAKGMILYGPPGTGKTLICQAIAKETKATLIMLRATDLVSYRYGEAEKNVQAFFNQVSLLTQKGYVIIFIDEIDSVFPQRDQSHEATQKMVSVFLLNFDGMLKSNPRFMFIGTTNKLSNVDDAILRSGRTDIRVEVGLPDLQGKIEIIKIQLRNFYNRAKIKDNWLDNNQNFVTELAQQLGPVSGADIEWLIRGTINRKAAAEAMNKINKEKGTPWSPITVQDIMETYKEMNKNLKNPRGPLGFAPPTKK